MKRLALILRFVPSYEESATQMEVDAKQYCHSHGGATKHPGCLRVAVVLKDVA